jgi:flagellar motor component MotA
MAKLNELSTTPQKKVVIKRATLRNDMRQVLGEKRVSQADHRELMEFFMMLATQARKCGLTYLDTVVPLVDDPFIRKALELVADGDDPRLVEMIMGNKKKSLLANLETRLSLVLTAVRGIQLGHNPATVRDCCEALL